MSEKHKLPFGMVLTVGNRGNGLDPGSLFEELGTEAYFDITEKSGIEKIAASGAGEALVAFIMAMAGEGIPVWKDEFKRALEEAVESISNEIH